MLDKDKRVARRAANKAGRASAEGKTKLGRTVAWKKTKAAARKAKRKGTTPVVAKKKVDTPNSKVMTQDYSKPEKKVVKQKHASPGGKSGATKRGTGVTYRTSWDANKSGVQAKYKDKGGYDAYRKDAVAWNDKKDAKKAKPKAKVVPLKLNKTDPLKGKGAGGGSITKKVKTLKMKHGGTVKKKYSDGGRIQHD